MVARIGVFNINISRKIRKCIVVMLFSNVYYVNSDVILILKASLNDAVQHIECNLI